MTKNENRVKGIESTSSTSIDSNNNQQNNNNEQLVPKIFIESIDDLHIDTTNTMTTTNNSNLSPTKEQITRPRRSSSPLAFLSKKFGRKKTTNGCLEDHQHHHQHSKSDPNSPPTPSNSPVDLYILQQYSKDMNGNNNNNNNNTSSSLPNNNVNNNNNVQQQQQQSFQPISLSPKHRSSSSSSSSSHRRNSSTSSSSSSSTTSFSPTLETSAFTLISSFSSLSSSSSININQLPHTIILKIIGYLANLKMDEKNNEIKLDRSRPDLPTLSTSTNSSPPLVSSTTSNNSLDLTSSTNNNNNIGSIPNLELETLSMVCKLWGKVITPQVFQHFVVKSHKHLKALIQLSTRGIIEGGKPFHFRYIAMILDKSSKFQKFISILKHTNKLPEKFVRATSKPMLSNIPSQLFSTVFDVCTSVEYFRFYQKWTSADNYAAIGTALANNTTVTHLSFRNSRLEDGILTEVIAALRHNSTIVALDLRHNHLGNGTAISLAGALIKNRAITHLDITYNLVGPEGGVAIANSLRHNKTLRKLSMNCNQTDTQTAIVMAQAMQSNHECALESLALDRLGDAGGAAILESLCDASHPLALNELLLTDSKLSLQTAQALSRAISTPTCRLADAIFRCNLIGCAQIDIPSNGGTLDDHLFKSIALNQTITRLSLADNRIPDEMGSHLAKALRDNTAITSLSLSLNRLGALFASELSEALVCNQTLLMLDLSNNQLDYDCGRQLMSGLLSNHALRLLNLSQNPLSSKIGQVIASTLIHNSTLTQLELSYVGLGTEGAVSLASQPLPLIKLNLSENQIQDQGGLALANSLQHNKYLQVLDLSYNSFTYRVKERFEKQQNDQHKHLSQLSLSSIPLNWKFQL